MTWKTCATHGPDNPAVWGCPECLRELRHEHGQLQARIRQTDVNFNFVFDTIEQIHANLCPEQSGTWQDRVNQAVQASRRIAEERKGAR